MIENKNLPAVILAAGKGERLGNLTEKSPKPMVRVNGIQIIDNLIQSLIDNQIERVIVVTGYLHNVLSKSLDKFRGKIDLILVENPIYATTNNIYSLWLTRKYLKTGFYLLEADIFFEQELMNRFVNSGLADIMLVGKHNYNMEGTVVQLDRENKAFKMFLKKEQINDFDYTDKYKTINFYRIGSKALINFFLDQLNSHIKRKDLNSYYEIIIKEAMEKGYLFFALKSQNLKWWEIDTPKDLKYCENLFSN